jgi:hypothetical protein
VKLARTTARYSLSYLSARIKEAGTNKWWAV